MIRYRLGDPDVAPADESPRLALGAVLGIVPLLLVGLFFWAALAPKPRVETKYRRRKGR